MRKILVITIIKRRALQILNHTSNSLCGVYISIDAVAVVVIQRLFEHAFSCTPGLEGAERGVLFIGEEHLSTWKTRVRDGEVAVDKLFQSFPVCCVHGVRREL
jgi:hypothetical protein